MLKRILFSVILLVLLVPMIGCTSETELRQLKEELKQKQEQLAQQVPDVSTPRPEAGRLSKQWKIVSINARVTEQNNTWWKYAWILVIKNDSSGRLSFDAIVSFLDADGFIIDDDREYNLLVEAGEQETFTGYTLIDASVAPNVKSVEVELKK